MAATSEVPDPTALHWYGALAQLGERLHGMQEVSGSIPLGSTNFSADGIAGHGLTLWMRPGRP